jgi:beta-galactosidase
MIQVIAEPASIPKVSYGEISVQRCAALLSERSIAVVTDGSVRGEIAPLSFEQLGQAMGFVLYSLREVSLHAGTNNLTLLGLHDRAHVLLDGVQIAIASRGAFDTVEITLQASTDEVRRLDILVENLGRINFGPFMTDRKGLLRTPLLNMEALVGGGMSGWEMRKLPLEDQHALAVEAVCTEDEDSVGGPVWYRGELFVEQVEGDTWLNMECWGKGVIWLNGFNLGRYWAWGPQQTLYVPAPLLREGTNDILVLELDGAKADLSIPTVSAPIFNSTEITCAK